MELLVTDDHFILLEAISDQSLWIHRRTQSISTKSGAENEAAITVANPTCLGIVHGYLGKINFGPGFDARLVFIRQKALVGVLDGCEIFKILSVVSVPLQSEEIELILEACPKRTAAAATTPETALSAQYSATGGTSVDSPSVVTVHHQSDQGQGHFRAPPSIEYTGQKNLWKVRAGTAPIIGQGTQTPAVNPAVERISPLLRRNDRLDKVEKKIVDEFHKMFTDADSFYYSTKYDLTNTLQRQYQISEKEKQKQKSGDDTGTGPISSSLYNADTRFVWNYHMLSDLIQVQTQTHRKEFDLERWILPIIHGYIEHGRCSLDLDDGAGPLTPMSPGPQKRVPDPHSPVADRAPAREHDHIDLWLISRRSRFRAGTRYLRRGVDEEGKVANYVETEQLMIFEHHKTSFVQVRGSIPLFWSQSSQRYRPTPRLERTEEETFSSFRTHFEEEGGLYGPIVIVNLVDKGGREKILGDAYLANVLRHNSPEITYLSFDFHEHCRGMHFENVATVISRLEDVFTAMSYCWVDSYGIVLQQKGVLRVNCVDCLDRTNLTQTQFGRHVLETQLSKLGLLAPEIGLAKPIKACLQTMWANNGDTISKQYAGTNALKGDYTRTGERKLTSALKDGMNSANRYYLNRFRDIHRQAAIDVTMGTYTSATAMTVKALSEDDDGDGEDGHDRKEKETDVEVTVEQIRTVIDDVKKCIVPKNAAVLGAWCFVNAKKNAPGEMDVDTVFILTEEFCFTTEYDCALDSITHSEAARLQDLKGLELTSVQAVPCLRIAYIRDGQEQSHEFLSSNIQFSCPNGGGPAPVLHIQQAEEVLESLKSVAEAVQVASAAVSHPIQLQESISAASMSVSKPTLTLLPNPSPEFGAAGSRRLSLPVAVACEASMPLAPPTRSLTPTPEITVTEFQPQDTCAAQTQATQAQAQFGGDIEQNVNSSAKLGVSGSGMTKRLSKSSEDISSDLELDMDEHGSQKLSPAGGSGVGLSKDNRSSSIQNLFNSALAATATATSSMKSSRSENVSLARPATAGATTTGSASTRIAALNPLSKDSVLVPLAGRLARGVQKGANYFDPRKLKDTFKPGGPGGGGAKGLQDDAQAQRKEQDREYMLALEEKKKNCRSLIIEM